MDHTNEDSQQALTVVGPQRCNVLRELDIAFAWYNALSEGDRREGWRVRAEHTFLTTRDMQQLESKLLYYTSVLSSYINLSSIGTRGRMGTQMKEPAGN